MQHTYLRYECADAFSLCTSSSSSTAPSSNSILAFLPPSSSKTKKTQQASTTATPPILATAGSQCIGYDLRQNLPCMKLAHRERLSGGLGTGRALNSDEIVCIDVSSSGGEDDVGGALVATGWVDGSIRIFTLHSNEISKRGGSSSSHKNLGMVHSLLQENEEYDDDFVSRDPLVLDGHSGTAVRSIAFDKLGQSQNDNSSCGRLASGGVDGSVVVWDIIAETGLFRLLGHRGAITDVAFVKPGGTGLVLFDGLVTSSLDGMVKVWDLNAQCCTQTIASHRGEVLCAAATRLGMSFVAGGGGGGGTEERKGCGASGGGGVVRIVMGAGAAIGGGGIGCGVPSATVGWGGGGGGGGGGGATVTGGTTGLGGGGKGEGNNFCPTASMVGGGGKTPLEATALGLIDLGGVVPVGEKPILDKSNAGGGGSGARAGGGGGGGGGGGELIFETIEILALLSQCIRFSAAST
mmetsp:Transcript_16500/g.24494  ORF Transcript_16500/g.24494 Transcript_16500/m.24494 type:complete len:465 (-) Transcript_16500:74-1468(-)